MSEVKKLRTKAVEIEAMQLTGTAADCHDVTSWIEANGYPFLVGNALYPDTLRYRDQVKGDDSRPDKGIYIDPATGDLMIRTLEGDMRASYGDWIFKGLMGEFYPCKDSVKVAKYDEVGSDV